jgi:hypothetical protein
MAGKEFRDKVLKLLKDRSRSLKLEQIAQDLSISTSWLKSFQNNKIDAPSVITMVDLYNYLNNKKLKF